MEAVKRRKIFRDVVRGYSSTILDEDFVYIKHLTPHDQVELEEIEEKYFDIACERISRAQAQGQLIPHEQPKQIQESLV